MKNYNKRIYLQNIAVTAFCTLFNFMLFFTTPKYSFARESQTFEKIKIREKKRNNKSSQQRNQQDILNKKENISQKNEIIKLNKLPRRGKTLGFGSEYIRYERLDSNFLQSVGSSTDNTTTFSSRRNYDFSNKFFSTRFRSKIKSNSLNLKTNNTSSNIFLKSKNISPSITTKNSLRLSDINQIRSGFSELFLGSFFLIIISCIQIEQKIFKQIDSDKSSLQNKSSKIGLFQKIKNFLKKRVTLTVKNIEYYYRQYLCLLAICIFIYFNQTYLKSNLISGYNFISNYLSLNGIISDKRIQRSRWLEKNTQLISTEVVFADKVEKIVSEGDSITLINKKESDLVTNESPELLETIQNINIDQFENIVTEIEVPQLTEFIDSKIFQETNVLKPVELETKDLEQRIQEKQKEVINAAIEVMEIERNEINEGREKIYAEFLDYKKKVGVLTEYETAYENYLNEQKIKSKQMNREFRETIERMRAKKTTRATHVSRRNAAREKVKRENEIKRKKKSNN
jgi:hypothetical protein